LSKINVLGVIPDGRQRKHPQRRGEAPGEPTVSESQLTLFPASEALGEKT
jgi:hypothetical protein